MVLGGQSQVRLMKQVLAVGLTQASQLDQVETAPRFLNACGGSACLPQHGCQPDILYTSKYSQKCATSQVSLKML